MFLHFLCTSEALSTLSRLYPWLQSLLMGKGFKGIVWVYRVSITTSQRSITKQKQTNKKKNYAFDSSDMSLVDSGAEGK